MASLKFDFYLFFKQYIKIYKFVELLKRVRDRGEEKKKKRSFVYVFFRIKVLWSKSTS